MIRNRSPFCYNTMYTNDSIDIGSSSSETDRKVRDWDRDVKICDDNPDIYLNQHLPTYYYYSLHGHVVTTTTRLGNSHITENKNKHHSGQQFANQRQHTLNKIDSEAKESLSTTTKYVLVCIGLTFSLYIMALSSTLMIPKVTLFAHNSHDEKQKTKGNLDYLYKLQSQWKHNPPSAIVVGSGLAGLSATVQILDRGGTVVLIEKNGYLGGNSNKASSGMNSCCSSSNTNNLITNLSKSTQEKQQDSIELFTYDTAQSAGSLAQPHLIQILTTHSHDAMKWLQHRVGVDLSQISQLGGHSVARTYRPQVGMVGIEIIYKLEQIIRAYERQGLVTILLNTQVTRLLVSTKNTSNDSTATNNDSFVVGVACSMRKDQDDGGTRTRSSTSIQFELNAPSTILATGGFEANRPASVVATNDSEAQTSLVSYLQQYRPDLVSMPTTAGSFSTGDGIALATRLSLFTDNIKDTFSNINNFIPAALVDMDQIQIHPTGFVDPSNPTSISKTLAAEVLRGVGGILLDTNGQRFCNELGTRDYISRTMLSHHQHHDDVDAENNNVSQNNRTLSSTFFLLLSSYAARGAQNHVDRYVRQGLLNHVHGLEELSNWMNVSQKRMTQTLDTYYNKVAVSNQVDSFGKKTFPGIRGISVKSYSNETVTTKMELSDEDFYIGIVTPVVHYCMGGLKITTTGQVVNTNNRIIHGLYAAGEVTGGVHGKNRLGGNSLLECTVFGSIIGQTIPILTTGNQQQATATLNKGHHDYSTVSTTNNSSSLFLRIVLRSELQRHNEKNDCWVAINGIVYNLTTIAKTHPGGSDWIYQMAGTDATRIFMTMHHHQANTILNQASMVSVQVGRLFVDGNDSDQSKTHDLHNNDETDVLERRKLPKMTSTELADKQHRNQKNNFHCWVAIYGIVYDLTEFIQNNRHPGGSKPILKLCGTDGTRLFQTVHNNNNNHMLLESVRNHQVAILVNDDDSTSMTSQPKETNRVSNNNNNQQQKQKQEPQREELRIISMEELHRHNTLENAWIAIEGYVYDVTAFAMHHKGGAYQIYKHAGTDVTRTFNILHNKKGTKTMDAFTHLIVGILDHSSNLS